MTSDPFYFVWPCTSHSFSPFFFSRLLATSQFSWQCKAFSVIFHDETLNVTKYNTVLINSLVYHSVAFHSHHIASLGMDDDVANRVNAKSEKKDVFFSFIDGTAKMVINVN